MSYEPLKRLAQIEDGDTVKTRFRGKTEIWRDVTVLNENSNREEILLKPKGNIYFITRSVLYGVSWASEVMVMWHDNGSDAG